MPQVHWPVGWWTMQCQQWANTTCQGPRRDCGLEVDEVAPGHGNVKGSRWATVLPPATYGHENGPEDVFEAWLERCGVAPQPPSVPPCAVNSLARKVVWTV